MRITEFRVSVKPDRQELFKAFLKELIDDDLKPGEWFWEQVQAYLRRGEGSDTSPVRLASAAIDQMRDAVPEVPALTGPSRPQNPKSAKTEERQKGTIDDAMLSEVEPTPYSEIAETADYAHEAAARHWNPLAVNFGEEWLPHIEAMGGWGEMNEEMLSLTATQAESRLKMKIPASIQKEALEWVTAHYEENNDG